MELHHVRIEAPDGTGATASIHLDDQALRSVTAATIHLEPNSVALVELELVMPSVEFDGKAQVTIPDSTAATLIELGWTPPGDDQ